MTDDGPKRNYLSPRERILQARNLGMRVTLRTHDEKEYQSLIRLILDLHLEQRIHVRYVPGFTASNKSFVDQPISSKKSVAKPREAS